MKNYSRKTNAKLTRYRTPATFRVRSVMQTNRVKFQNRGKNVRHQPQP